MHQSQGRFLLVRCQPAAVVPPVTAEASAGTVSKTSICQLMKWCGALLRHHPSFINNLLDPQLQVWNTMTIKCQGKHGAKKRETALWGVPATLIANIWILHRCRGTPLSMHSLLLPEVMEDTLHFRTISDQRSKLRGWRTSINIFLPLLLESQTCNKLILDSS